MQAYSQRIPEISTPTAPRRLGAVTPARARVQLGQRPALRAVWLPTLTTPSDLTGAKWARLEAGIKKYAALMGRWPKKIELHHRDGEVAACTFDSDLAGLDLHQPANRARLAFNFNHKDFPKTVSEG